MKSQDDILSIKRVAYSLQAIDPETGDNEKKAALAALYKKAYEVWRAENLFLPEKLLEDGGILAGGNTALFYIPPSLNLKLRIMTLKIEIEVKSLSLNIKS